MKVILRGGMFRYVPTKAMVGDDQSCIMSFSEEGGHDHRINGRDVRPEIEWEFMICAMQ